MKWLRRLFRRRPDWSRWETFEVFTLYGQPGRVQIDVSRTPKAQREHLLHVAASWFKRVISWKG